MLIFRLFDKENKECPEQQFNVPGQSTGVLLEELLVVFEIRIKETFDVGSAGRTELL